MAEEGTRCSLMKWQTSPLKSLRAVKFSASPIVRQPSRELAVHFAGGPVLCTTNDGTDIESDHSGDLSATPVSGSFFPSHSLPCLVGEVSRIVEHTPHRPTLSRFLSPSLSAARSGTIPVQLHDRMSVFRLGVLARAHCAPAAPPLIKNPRLPSLSPRHGKEPRDASPCDYLPRPPPH